MAKPPQKIFNLTNKDIFLSQLVIAVSKKDVNQIDSVMAEASEDLLKSLSLRQEIFQLFKAGYDKSTLIHILNNFHIEPKNFHLMLEIIMIIKIKTELVNAVNFDNYVRDCIQYIPSDQRILCVNQCNLFCSGDLPESSRLLRILYDELGYGDISDQEFQRVFYLILGVANKLSVASLPYKTHLLADASPKKHILSFIRNGLPMLKDKNVSVLRQTVDEFIDYLKTQSSTDAENFSVVKKALTNGANDNPVFLAWGVGEHAIGVVKYGKFLIVSDRRGGRYVSDDLLIGTTVYELQGDFNQLFNNETNLIEFNKNLQAIVAPKPVAEFIETGQKRGTCSFTNYKAVIKGLIALDLQLKQNQKTGVSTRAISNKNYEKALTLYKKYTSYYRDREIEKLISLYKEPSSSRLAREQIFSAFYDYITGHYYLNQTKDKQRIAKILMEIDICDLTFDRLNQFEMDILLLLQVCKFAKCDAPHAQIIRIFSNLTQKEKIKVLENSDNILTSTNDELLMVARNDPQLIIELGKTSWFVLRAYNSLKETIINNDKIGFDKIVNFLTSHLDAETLSKIINAEDENLIALSIFLKQKPYEMRLKEMCSSVANDKMVSAPQSPSLTDIQMYFDTIINSNFTFYPDEEEIQRRFRIALNTLSTAAERLHFLTTDGFTIFKIYRGALANFYINEIKNCGASSSEFKETLARSGIIEFLNDLHFGKMASQLSLLGTEYLENTIEKRTKGLFWNTKETVFSDKKIEPEEFSDDEIDIPPKLK